MFRRTHKHQAPPQPPVPPAGPPAVAPPEQGEECAWELPEDLRVPPPESVGGTAHAYAGPLVIDGQTRVCSRCGATEDWLLLMSHATEQITVRCRCRHEWHEPGVTAAWFRAVSGPVTAYYPDTDSLLQAQGFDGTTPTTP
ncbi:hypothetical protein ACWGCC_03950 [Streptomyces nigrescens]